MSNRLMDLRSPLRTIEEAEALHAEIARAEIQIEVARARAEARIATIKKETDAKTAPVLSEIAEKRKALAAFIDGRRELFKRPRTRKTDWGEFGLRSVTDLLIDDREALIDELLERGYDDCLKTTRSPVKAAIRDRIRQGEDFPGARLRTGDTAVCTTARALIREAVEEAA
jgi:hypothetical protein